MSVELDDIDYSSQSTDQLINDGEIETFEDTNAIKENPNPLPTVPKLLNNAIISSSGSTTAKRVVKVGRNIKGFYCDYSIPKLLKWDHNKKRNRNYWIDIETPTEDDMLLLQEKFDLHPLTTNEILHPDAIEKFEAFEDRKYIFIVSKELHYKRGSNELVSVNINMIVFPNLVMTFHEGEVLAVDAVLTKVRHLYSVKEDNNYERHSKFMKTSDWTVYAILNSLLEMFDSYTERIVMEADALDELVLVFNSGEQNDLLRRIGLARRLLSFVKTALRAKGEILKTLCIKENPLITPDIKVYLRDIDNDVNRLDGKLSVTKDTLNNLHQTYLARLSIEVAESSNKTNGVMATFSAVATIFIPINFLASLMGMNVKVPYDHGETLVPFFVVLAIMLFCVLFTVAIFTIRKYW